MARDSDFKNFVDLDDNMKNKLSYNKEKFMYKFPDLRFGIKDFTVIEDQNIVIAVCR